MRNSPNAILLSLASVVSAQYGPNGQYGPGSGSFDGAGGGQSDGQSGGFDYSQYTDFFNNGEKLLIVHGVLASLAFVLLFPMGSILIRLGSFRGLWLVHGLFQIFAYLVYIAAFGIAIWIVNNVPVSLIGRYHPVIGIIVFCLLFFQPILGLLHHFAFKKYRRRTVWSYGHLWLGRIVITLGMINGGLGMLLATETGFYKPSNGQIVAYAVVAGFMWLLWVLASVVGERKRARNLRAVAQEGRFSPQSMEQPAGRAV